MPVNGAFDLDQAPSAEEGHRLLALYRYAEIRFVAVTRLVAANGLPYQNRHPRPRRVTSVAPSVAKRLRVKRRGSDVGNRQAPTGFEHTPGFGDRLRTVSVRLDVVNGEAGDHEIEGSVGKRERPHVARLDVDSIRHAFDRRVVQRDLARVSGLIVRAPQVDAGDAPGPESSRDGDEDRASSTPHVEHAFVAAKVKFVEEVVPDQTCRAWSCRRNSQRSPRKNTP